MIYRLINKLKPSGQKVKKVILALGVLIIICGSMGCEKIKTVLHEEFLETDASSDWTIDLMGDYQIWRINERCIMLCRKHTNDSGATDVIENFFVTRYCLIDSYICVEGIPTKADFITEEEKETSIVVYYIVDTEKNSIEGPFRSFQEMQDRCGYMDVPVIETWKKAEQLDK